MRARIRAGDPEAFRVLFDEHSQTVYRHAVRVLGDWAAAEDVTSLVFLEAWRLREGVRAEPEEPLRPWLFGICTNVLRNTARAARRHEAALRRVPASRALPDFADELAGRLDDADELAAAQRALARLRRGEREVFTLCVWSGLSYAEAAEALGVAVGTVRSRLARARKRLLKLSAEELSARSGRRNTEPPAARGQVPDGHPLVARPLRKAHR